MSYDLYFQFRSSGQTLSQGDFASYFGSRPFYEIKPLQALYSHTDTGVYFFFDFLNSEEIADRNTQYASDSTFAPVSFNLNYFRPHPFGLEAEFEVAALIKHFDLLVHDTQMSGMSDGEYSRDGFLRGWNVGNEFAYHALLSRQPTQKVLTLDFPTFGGRA